MPLFRNSFVTLDVTTPINASQTGPAFRVRPVDGDAVADHDQHYRCVLDVHKVGPGTAKMQLFTSWDGAHWFPVAESAVSGADTQHFELADVIVLGPFIQGRSSVLPANPGDPLPNHHGSVRITSDGPFNIRPV